MLHVHFVVCQESIPVAGCCKQAGSHCWVDMVISCTTRDLSRDLHGRVGAYTAKNCWGHCRHGGHVHHNDVDCLLVCRRNWCQDHMAFHALWNCGDWYDKGEAFCASLWLLSAMGLAFVIYGGLLALNPLRMVNVVRVQRLMFIL
jgi:hypothetical protein